MGTLGQHPHLVRHHGKATALFAGPCRLDGGVERQQVGLLGDAADGRQNAADLLGMGIQLIDDLAGIGHFIRQPCDAALALANLGLARNGELDRIPRGGGRKLGVTGDLLSRRSHLGHRSRHHDDLVLLLAHPLAASQGAGRLSTGLGCQLDGHIPQAADDAVQAGHKLVEALGQLAHFILAAGVDVDCKVPLAVGDIVQRPCHPAQILEQVLEGAGQHQAEHQDQTRTDE